MQHAISRLALVLLISMLAVQVQSSLAQSTAAPKQYVYVLRVAPRLHDEKAWTDRDNAAVAEHFKRLKEATATGKVILAGRTDEPFDQTFGLVVFEAASPEQAREFMLADPAIVAAVMTATLHPYSVALLRK